MAVRTATAVAVLAAAAAVLVLVSRDRRWRRQVAAQRLIAGCAHRDNAALVAQLEEFRRRLVVAANRPDVCESAGREAREDAMTSTRIDPPMEGGPVCPT
jgi:uncharacterized membrane protein